MPIFGVIPVRRQFFRRPRQFGISQIMEQWRSKPKPIALLKLVKVGHKQLARPVCPILLRDKCWANDKAVCSTYMAYGPNHKIGLRCQCYCTSRKISRVGKQKDTCPPYPFCASYGLTDNKPPYTPNYNAQTQRHHQRHTNSRP